MAALPGKSEDWVEGKDGGWSHPGFAGVVYVTPPKTFAEYHAQRASEPAPIDKLADLETRIAALEARTTAEAETGIKLPP